MLGREGRETTTPFSSPHPVVQSHVQRGAESDHQPTFAFELVARRVKEYGGDVQKRAIRLLLQRRLTELVHLHGRRRGDAGLVPGTEAEVSRRDRHLLDPPSKRSRVDIRFPEFSVEHT
jgi:hypothetical protein